MPVATRGQVTSVCVFGYPRFEHEELDEEGRFDVASSDQRLFVQVALYRPADKAKMLYTRVYRSIVVNHHVIMGCTSLDGLNWIVKPGDLLGAFIPENCTTPEDLISQDDVDTFNEMELKGFNFCPSQINLVNDAGQCFHALYLNLTEGVLPDEIESVDFVNVSTKLNMQVTIKDLGKRSHAYSVANLPQGLIQGGGCGG